MKAILVDDEESNRILLASMLKKHCPKVIVLGEAASADAAFTMINDLKPDLVFLDIKMPRKNGFDLLRSFKQIDFSVIFITGFDEYALKAFEFNAIDYILKPIDYVKLIASVKKVQQRLHSDLGNIVHFVHSLEEKTNYVKRLSFHEKDKVNIINLNDILYIVADRGYCEIIDISNKRHLSAKTLAEYEDLLLPFKNFIRANKKYIINNQHIKSYTKGISCTILMNGSDIEIEVSRRKKNEIIAALKIKP